MYKISPISIFYFLFILLALTACGSSGGDSNDSNSGTVTYPSSIDTGNQKETVFAATYGDINVGERAITAQMTSDGGYILLGVQGLTVFGQLVENDIYLVKVDSEGRETWSKNFDYSDYGDSAGYVRETSDGGFIIVGATDTNFGSNIMLMIKTDSMGNEQWIKSYVNNNIFHKTISITSDSEFIILGHGHYVPNNTELSIVKLDDSFKELWSKNITVNNKEDLKGIRETGDGGYLLTGNYYDPDIGGIYLVKLDSDCIILWSKIFRAGDQTKAYSIEETTDKGFIIAGYTYSSDHAKMYLIKTDSSGNELWNRTIGANDNISAMSVYETSDGGFILTGHNPFAVGGYTIYLIKTDSNGDEQWRATYEGVAAAHGFFVKETPDAGYIIAGSESRIDYYGFYTSDMLLIKTDNKGHWTN